MNIKNHGRAEGFCPRCFDYRPFDVKEHVEHGAVGAFCPKCSWNAHPDEVPHDADEAEEMYPDEI